MRITRRYAVDVMPSGAYWREPTLAEQKVDFKAIEEDEGVAVQGARLRLGLLLYAQRNLIIRWLDSARFTPVNAGRVPGFMGRQLISEFVRIRLRGYYDGTVDLNRSLDKPLKGLLQMATDRKVAAAQRAGMDFVSSVLAPIRKITATTFAANGKRLKTTTMLAGEIRAAYAKWLDLAEGRPELVDLYLVAPLDVVGMAWRTWQEKNAPISGFLEAMFRDLRAQRRIPILPVSTTQDTIVTTYNNEANNAIYEGSLRSSEIEALQYSAIRDARTCLKCYSLDGTIRPKDDYKFWGTYTPPIHLKCRCRVTPVRGDEAAINDMTPANDLLNRLTKVGSIAPGFGGYDPND
jgi:SPP1 gp7 family putative phage head morphogenesis protein